MRMLIDGDYTCQELAEETGLHYLTVLQYCRELYKAGAAYIARWDQDKRGRHCVKVYKIGIGRNATKKRLTASERQKRYREKQKAHQITLATKGLATIKQSANGMVRFDLNRKKLTG